MSRAFIQKRLPFKPTDIGGCSLWLDAADSTTLSLTGSVVNTWRDKSSNGYTGTSSGSPTLVANSQNGLPCISFSAASSQYFNFGNILPQTAFAVFIVMKTTFVPGTNQAFIGKSSFSGESSRWTFIYDGSILYSIIQNGGGPTASATPYSGVFTLFTLMSALTDNSLYANGTSIGTNTPYTTYTTNNDYVLIGAYQNPSGTVPPQAGYFYNGIMGEIIYYNTSITPQQRQQLESYLAQKWGLQTSLPQGHPGTRGIVYPQTPLQNWVPWRYPSAFVPTSIGNCQIWLDGADSSTVILNGSTVSQWTDKSAAGNNATQPTAGNQPSYSASGIVFAGNQWLITPIGVNPTAESFFIVFKTTNNLAEIFSGTNANGREVLIVSGVMYLSKYGTNPVGLTPNGGSVPTNTVTLFDYQYTTSLVTLNLNGLQAGSGTPAVSYSGTGTSYIGSSTYAANNMYGTIYEIIYYNVSLTTNQFQQVEGYLAWKWGIQANLPANHPYKNSSPSTTNPGGVSRPANLPVPPITIYAGPRPPTYVTSGLLFYLDAGNATSYPGSGSTWTDLAGSGLTTTLYNSPTYSSANGGYLAFAPGSSQYGQTSASLATLSSWSLEVWHYYTATNTGSLPCIITEVWSSTPINFTLGSGSGSTSSLQVGYYNNGWFTTTGSYSLPSVGWYHIVGTYDGANLKLYVNNVLTQTSASTTASVSSALGIRFMRRWDSPEYWGGYLAIIRIYNRALSATEVTTNYAASKARFGLS